MMATTAKYVRLSSEDDDLRQGGKLESNSIANQRDLLDAFINRMPELAGTNIIEFCDDGWSGKNFERPAVQEMIAQARAGKIQCIVVKDLSRFGRDYLTVGSYISSVFPFLGVRFIAVNDGYDSIRPLDVDSLDTSFKTLLYDFYSRDLSRMVRKAKRFRAQRGDFLSPFAPYGFIKDPANKNHLLIDPPAADIVRRIFRMMGSGHPSEQIAKRLNSEAVLTPMLYKRAAGCSRTSWPSVREENIWTKHIITKIIRDERYIGTNVYGKRMRDQVGHHHTVKISKAEWITASGTHDGIVTQEEFDKAQLSMREFMERDGINLGEWVLRHKVRCGVCGYSMTRSKAKHPVYYCRTNRISDAFACPSERVPEADILEAVLDGLHVQAMAAVEMARIWEERHRRKKTDTAALRKNIAALREAHSKLGRQIKDLYTSFGLGEISRAEYLTAKASAIRKRDAAAKQLDEWEAKLENTGEDGELQNQFIIHFRPYVEAEIKEITQEILSDILREIHIYPGGRLEIIWNYREEYAKMMLDLEGEQQNGT
jgi:DNA invertase Pin-like site-specific DNA recombinase